MVLFVFFLSFFLLILLFQDFNRIRNQLIHEMNKSRLVKNTNAHKFTMQKQYFFAILLHLSWRGQYICTKYWMDAVAAKRYTICLKISLNPYWEFWVFVFAKLIWGNLLVCIKFSVAGQMFRWFLIKTLVKKVRNKRIIQHFAMFMRLRVSSVIVAVVSVWFGLVWLQNSVCVLAYYFFFFFSFWVD